MRRWGLLLGTLVLASTHEARAEWRVITAAKMAFGADGYTLEGKDLCQCIKQLGLQAMRVDLDPPAPRYQLAAVAADAVPVNTGGGFVWLQVSEDWKGLTFLLRSKGKDEYETIAFGDRPRLALDPLDDRLIQVGSATALQMKADVAMNLPHKNLSVKELAVCLGRALLKEARTAVFSTTPANAASAAPKYLAVRSEMSALLSEMTSQLQAEDTNVRELNSPDSPESARERQIRIQYLAQAKNARNVTKTIVGDYTTALESLDQAYEVRANAQAMKRSAVRTDL